MISSPKIGIVSLNDLSPPTAVESYAIQWEKQRQPGKRETVLDAAWHDNFLAVCTSLGWVYIWMVPYTNLSDIHKVQSAPIASFPVDQSTILSSIQFSGHDEETVLVISGAGGIVMYSWKTLLEDVVKKRKIEPILRLHQDQNVTHFHIDENNIVYVATNNGCYKYEKKTGKLLIKMGNARVNSVSVDGNDLTVLLGCHDGSLEVYRDDGTHVETIDMNATLKETIVNKNNNNKSTMSRSNLDYKIWITAIHINAPWWIVSGGVQTRNKSVSHSTSVAAIGGFVATLHGPTRSLVSSTATRETIQAMMSSNNGDILITSGNESVVSSWNPLNYEQSVRAWCSPPSGHALAVRKQDGLLVVGGVGNAVDLFDGYNMTKLFSLSLMEH